MSRIHADPTILTGVEAFAREVLAPMAAEIDETGRFAGVHLPKLAEMGLMGLNLAAEDGGLGVDAWTIFEATAIVAGACGSTASMITAHWLATDSIVHGGSPEQRARWLPRAAAGEILGAFGLTEPGAGSNPVDMTTRAVREGEGWRLHGVKHFISNAAHADFIVVYAKTDPTAGARGISAFVVEPSAGGVTIGGPERTMGLRGGHVFEVVLDCLVPDENRLGAPGSGFKTALKTLDAGRLDIAACAVGVAEAAFAAAIAWAKSRIVEGRPIAEFQGLQWKIADMGLDLAASRGLADAATAKRAKGERFSTEAAMAKLHASEMAGRVTDAALQIHGGYGYTRDFPLERWARDVRILRIYEGSSEIQRNILARTLLA
ncbi:MAG: acyl-CoA dehydrogenase [Phyllobacteriaceae bacterium]|nr:acyl-CoA dehydrogenase [Phyllobacteriaceae bacterium]